MLADLVDIIRRVVDPLLDSRALYPCKVIAVSGQTLDLRPESSLWSDRKGVPLRSGAAGDTVTLATGSRVYMGFENGDRRQPFAVAVDTGASPTPTARTIDATGTVAIGASASSVNLGPALGSVIRVGDTIKIDPGNGAGLVAGVITVTLGLGVPPAPSPVKA